MVCCKGGRSRVIKQSFLVVAKCLLEGVDSNPLILFVQAAVILRSEEDGVKINEAMIIGNDEFTCRFKLFRAECFGDRGLVGGPRNGIHLSLALDFLVLRGGCYSIDYNSRSTSYTVRIRSTYPFDPPLSKLQFMPTNLFRSKYLLISRILTQPIDY